MIFKDKYDEVIRIPNDLLCGIKKDDECKIYCAGDVEFSTFNVDEVTFRHIMQILGDEQC